MNGPEEYRFKIDAYSPETIPMGRLAEYLGKLAALLANNDSVHFDRLEPGSTVIVSKIEREAAPKVANRIEALGRNEAANDAREAVDQLNNMLRDDNAIGELYRMTDGQTAQILRFPGREIIKPQKVGPFIEPAIFDGELVRVGGRDKTAHAQIVDAEGRTWSGELAREQAHAMGAHLYEWLRVEGQARWERSENGQWELLRFTISNFRPLPKDTLAETIQKLRGIEGNEWKTIDDPLGFIRESRNDDDEIH